MTLTKMTDQQLLQAFAEGRQEAVDTLIDRHRKRIRDYIRMMVKDDALADDLLQETLIKVLGSLRQERYVDNGRFVAWAMRIAHNQIIDHFRRQRQLDQVGSEEAGYDLLNNRKFSDPTVEDQLVTDQIHADIRRLVDRLPAEQRDVVIMRHYHDMSFKDIAEQMNISINTALGRMRYALINLRKMIREKQIVLH